MIISLGITAKQLTEINFSITEYDAFFAFHTFNYFPHNNKLQILDFYEEVTGIIPVKPGDSVLCYIKNSYKQILLLSQNNVKVHLFDYENDKLIPKGYLHNLFS